MNVAKVELYNLWTKGSRFPKNGYYVALYEDDGSRYGRRLRTLRNFKTNQEYARRFAASYNRRARGRSSRDSSRSVRDSGPDTQPLTHHYAVRVFPMGRSKAKTFPGYPEAQLYAQDVLRDGRHRASVVYALGRRGSYHKVETWSIGPSGGLQRVYRFKEQTRDPKTPRTRKRKLRMSEEASAAASHIAAQLRELRAKDGYVVMVNIGPYDHNAHDLPLPDARFPKVYRALYEAVEHAENRLRSHDKLKIVRLTPSGEAWPPFYSQVVWRSWGEGETEDRRRQKARRMQIETARKGRTLEHARRDSRRRGTFRRRSR